MKNSPTYDYKLDGDEGGGVGVDLAEVEGGVPLPRPLDDQLPVVWRQVDEGVARVSAKHQPVSRQQVHRVTGPFYPRHLRQQNLFFK